MADSACARAFEGVERRSGGLVGLTGSRTPCKHVRHHGSLGLLGD